MLKGDRATPSLILFSRVHGSWNCKNILCGRECTHHPKSGGLTAGLKAITWVQTSRNVDITRTSNGRISVLLEDRVTRLGMLVVLQVYCTPIWPWPDPRSSSWGFWSSENCTVLCLSPPPFRHGAQNWWLITTSAIRSQISEFLRQLAVTWLRSSWKCWYHQNPLGFISALPEARSLWLWLQVGRNKSLRGFFYSYHVSL